MVCPPSFTPFLSFLHPFLPSCTIVLGRKPTQKTKNRETTCELPDPLPFPTFEWKAICPYDNLAFGSLRPPHAASFLEPSPQLTPFSVSANAAQVGSCFNISEVHHHLFSLLPKARDLLFVC